MGFSKIRLVFPCTWHQQSYCELRFETTNMLKAGNTEDGIQSTSEDDKYVYRMNHERRGYFLIFNNKTLDCATDLPDRTVTDEDVDYLDQVFKELGFDVEIKHNLKREEMIEEMEDASKWDHSVCDCFGCAILSYGDERFIYGTDGKIPLKELTGRFNGENCATLRGKPKIFIIQASKLEKKDDSHKLQADAGVPEEDKVHKIPQEADYIYVFSTGEGSSFINTLCKMIKQSEKVDFPQILTKVNNALASEQESMNRKIPSMELTLTKDLILTKKN